ncbi:MAG TPA: YbaB/EbfC family nucleoid-associated protein [Actinophytocola sp.]|uniref:YbaB/EbfC family nucleoid-associated protein n=1 Tax=Actinophytocola sp. TaxID=1872138 RepID=UPI002DDD2A26|nr:YbaB/EbfC family nucleoid-associated protein [Actinophytocola sp.]HEV2782193.1 YbaB/EbfC family nucleoid-associated protein [Actinophytocola sp.]
MTDSVPDAMRMIDDWERNATEKAARFQRMAEQVELVSITESVADGAVRVTVGHNGLPTDIAMTDGVRSMEPAQIAANVMAAIRKAQSRYPERLAEILADTVGEDDPAAQHILAKAQESFPPPPDEEVAPGKERMVFGDVEDDDRLPPPRPAPPRTTRAPDNGDEDFGDGSIFDK